MASARSARPSLGDRLRARRRVVVGAIAIGIAALIPTTAGAAPGLGTAGSVAIRAGSGITNTGPTMLNGDVGSFPTPTQTGFASVTLNSTNATGAGTGTLPATGSRGVLALVGALTLGAGLLCALISRSQFKPHR